jgi:NTE family protein
VPTVALALGGGGARGLAHIPVLEALDELGVAPAAIAGSSIGAIVGAAYTAGVTGRELRRHALDAFHDQGKVIAKLLAARVGRFVDLLGGLGNPVMVDATKLLEGFWPAGLPEDFAALRIPFTAVATDLEARDAVLLRTGELKSAVAASMAIPGLVRPVERDGLVLIDGAAADPVPVAAVRGAADLVVAVDLVAAPPLRSAGRAVAIPSAQEAVQAGFMVLQHRLVVERLARTPPDIHLAPQVSAFGTLDFLRAVAILRAAEPLKDELKRALEPLL